jgi:hypothetical protein
MSYDWWKEVEYEESKERAKRDYSKFVALQRKCGVNLGVSLEEWVAAWEHERQDIMRALRKLEKTKKGSRLSRLAAEIELCSGRRRY